ncbi:hypothetical protein JVX98_13855 [Ensifer sp. PDNC004]|uniref:hypothetical protein n=1 Tax=Ensifer sp. PDNC004 TaxID=2811423 RepID=UPI0019665CF1|nr:hypothetical protein [Ensifer sp. PDNC004]QRY69292.1 hypothetical protein JVX98_13855 [Ensifer sp. PDNC004]
MQNATSCWSTEIVERQWCDIVVQSLEGDVQQQSVILKMFSRPDDVTAMTTAIESRFSEFVAALERQGTPLDVAVISKEVPELLADNADVINECLNAAVSGKRGSNAKGLRGLWCSVGESSGWLRIEMPVADVRLVYLVAPLRGS